MQLFIEFLFYTDTCTQEMSSTSVDETLPTIVILIYQRIHNILEHWMLSILVSLLKLQGPCMWLVLHPLETYMCHIIILMQP